MQCGKLMHHQMRTEMQLCRLTATHQQLFTDIKFLTSSINFVKLVVHFFIDKLTQVKTKQKPSTE